MCLELNSTLDIRQNFPFSLAKHENVIKLLPQHIPHAHRTDEKEYKNNEENSLVS
jgi:hypothetical protein